MQSVFDAIRSKGELQTGLWWLVNFSMPENHVMFIASMAFKQGCSKTEDTGHRSPL